MAMIPLDDSRYAPDASASGLLPVALWSDAQQIGAVRHAGAGYAPDETRRHAVSTPSDVWRSIPILLRADHTTGSLHVSVRYTADLEGGTTGDDAVDVRLATPQGIGSSVTLTVTATPTTVEIEAPYRTGKLGDTVPCEIQIRSYRGATPIVTAADVDDVAESGLRWDVSHASGPALEDVAGHYEAVVTDWPLGMPTARTSWHVGRIETHSVGSDRSWYIWPSSTDALVSNGGVAKLGGEADLYAVGTLTLLGWYGWAEGQRDATPAVTMPQAASADVMTRASQWTALHVAVLGMGLWRGAVYHAGPRPTGSDACYGWQESGGGVVGSGAGYLRASGRVMVTLLLSGRGLATVTAESIDSSGATVDTQTATVQTQPVLPSGSVTQPAYETSQTDRSEALHGVDRWQGGTAAGWRDLAAASESYRDGCGWVTAQIALTAGAVGDWAQIEVSVDSAAHVYAVHICEA